MNTDMKREGKGQEFNFLETELSENFAYGTYYLYAKDVKAQCQFILALNGPTLGCGKVKLSTKHSSVTNSVPLNGVLLLNRKL